MKRWGAIFVVMSLALAAIPMVASGQVANTVLVYTGGGLGAPYQGHNAFGVATGKTVVVSETLPESLAEYDCVILPINNDLSGVTGALVSYVTGGGRLIAEGEGANFASANAAMNGLADALESSMDLVPADFDSGFNVTTMIDSSPFTAGVASISYAYTSGLAVTVGPTAHSLVRIADGSATFIGAEQIGSGLFVLSGDSNVFSDNSGDGYTVQNNGALAANVCDAASFEPAVQVDLSVAKVAEQASVTAGGQAAFSVTVTNNSETAATGVNVTDDAVFSDESGVNILSASGEGWECSIDGPAFCFLGDLAAGTTSSELLIVVQAPGSPGTITNTATVFGDQSDPNGENNSATATTEVTQAAAGETETFLETSDQPQTIETTGGQTWDTKMTVPANSPAGIYRLTELADIQQSRGNVEYQAPEGAVVDVQVTCPITQCPKRRFLDLVVIVIKTDDDSGQHLLPPCRLVIPRKNRPPLVIDKPPPCVLSVTRANNTAPLVWTVRLLGGPDPGIRGR